jgi:hypothetical protein
MDLYEERTSYIQQNVVPDFTVFNVLVQCLIVCGVLDLGRVDSEREEVFL